MGVGISPKFQQKIKTYNQEIKRYLDYPVWLNEKYVIKLYFNETNYKNALINKLILEKCEMGPEIVDFFMTSHGEYVIISKFCGNSIDANLYSDSNLKDQIEYVKKIFKKVDDLSHENICFDGKHFYFVDPDDWKLINFL